MWYKEIKKMENTSNDKNETFKYDFDEFFYSFKENSNPLSPFILRNTNKERPLIYSYC